MKTPSQDNSPEFSRPFAVDRLHDKPFNEPIEANEAEREALAKRLRLVAINRFEANITLHRVGDVVEVSGKLKAEVVQNCVVTLEDFTSKIEDEIRSYYIEAAKASRHAPKTEEDI